MAKNPTANKPRETAPAKTSLMTPARGEEARKSFRDEAGFGYKEATAR
jgi:hypothetical protein